MVFFASLTCCILDSELNGFLIAYICVRVYTDLYASKSLKKKMNACMEHDMYLKKSVISVYLRIYCVNCKGQYAHSFFGEDF